MSDYFECTPVGIDFLEQTKNVFVATEIVRATPEQIFDVFEDAHSWTVWALPIQKVEWTSPKPFGIGTTQGRILTLSEKVETRFMSAVSLSFISGY